MNKRILIASAALILIGASAGGGWWLAQRTTPHMHPQVSGTQDASEASSSYVCPMHPQVEQDGPGSCPICGMKLVKRTRLPATADEHATRRTERKVLYWYDPMRPDQHFDAPGKSPFMDMQLVPKYAEVDGMGDDSTIVQIDPRMAQNLGMRTAVVKTGSFWQRVDAAGSVAVNENLITVVEARAAGWVERLDVRAVGDVVREGQIVAGIYSPELLAAQEELTLARKLGDAALIEAAQERLRLLNASITGRPQRQTLIVTPRAGIVTELNVRQGAQVTPGMPLLKLADLTKVWILVEVPEAQASWVAEGKAAEARLKSQPGKVFEGSVDYVYPLLDTATRTLRARLVFDNADGTLKPGMFADVTVYGGARRDVTLVPAEAVIRTGTRNVVIVAEAAGRYRPVEIVPGPERGDEIVVLAGLEPGQKVVTSGQFLIDSEASLLGIYNRMGARGEDSESPATRMRNMGGETSPGAYPADAGNGNGS